MPFQVQDARQNSDDETVKKAVNDYDEAIERYTVLNSLLFVLV